MDIFKKLIHLSWHSLLIWVPVLVGLVLLFYDYKIFQKMLKYLETIYVFLDKCANFFVVVICILLSIWLLILYWPIIVEELLRIVY